MKGYVNISEAKSQGRSRFNKLFSSNSEFFANNKTLVVKINEECLTLSVPTLDFSGKTSSISKVGGTKEWYNFSLMIDVPTGTHFEFDEEESNEDRVVVYFKQK